MVDKLNSDQTQVDLNETRNKVNEILDALNRQIIIPWSPSEIPTLAWWDASDASTIQHTSNSVTQWNDKSGNGVNLTVPSANAAPTINTRTLNNLNVMEYAGTNSGFRNSNFSYNRSSKSFCISFICNIITAPTNVQHFYFSGTNSVSPGKRIMARSVSSNTALQIFGGTGSSNKVVGASGLTLRTSVLISIEFTPTGPNSAIRVNGDEKNTGDTGNNHLNYFNLGMNEGGAFSVEGFFGECILHNDNTMIEKIEGYLAHKWGLEGSLDSAHPYKDWNAFLRSSWGYNRL